MLCVAISSVGATDRLEACADSVEALADDRFVVGLCDQSADGSAGRRFRARCSRPTFVVTSAPGLSAGRNAVMEAAPAEVTHFAFPNDSSVLPSDLVTRVLDDHGDADVLACRYEDRPGDVRYHFEPGVRPLTMATSLLVIEPAMVVARAAFDRVGRFDERMGTGSAGVQSGEGTDLLLRLLADDPGQLVHWDPTIVVAGVPQAHGLTRRQQLRKHYRYAVGFGYLLTRWRFPVWFRVRALVAPLRFVLVRSDIVKPMDAAVISIGRARGMGMGMGMRRA